VKLAVAWEDSFDATYGLRHVDPAHGRVVVDARHLGAHGAVHSGVYASMAESIASTATAVEVVEAGFIVSGLSNATYVLADISEGTLEAAATCRARVEGEWLWDVEIRAGEVLAAQATIVIAVRSASRPAPRQGA
jgi:1,4-dihydroxy-2-naphthoyl-CoA hydrolase